MMIQASILRSNIKKSINAQIFGFIVNVLIQLMSVPILIRFWGVDKYGSWLILFAIPSFVGVSDLGMGSAVSNKVVFFLNKKEISTVNRLINSSFYFITLLASLISLIFIIGSHFLYEYRIIEIDSFSKNEFYISFSLLVFYFFLAILLSLPQGLYRALDIYARGQMLSSFYKLVETLFLIISVYLNGNFIHVSLVIVLTRIIYFFVLFCDLKAKANWLIISKPFLDYSITSTLFKSSSSFMFISLGQSFVLQGIILIVGRFGSSSEVVMYSTSRTILNISKQVTGFINNAFWGELTSTFASKNAVKFKQTFHKLFNLSFIVNVLMSIVLIFTGIWVIKIWTNNSFEIDSLFFYLMILLIFIENIYNTDWVTMMSINSHAPTVPPFLLISSIMIVISFWLYPSFGILCIPVIFISGSILLVLSFRKLRKSILKNLQ
jgi:O-antigen/teichoic acid export membrane protein